MRPLVPGDVRLLQRCLLIFYLLLQRFTVSVRAWTCSRSAATSEAVAEAAGVGVCAQPSREAISNIVTRVLKKNLVIKKLIVSAKVPPMRMRAISARVESLRKK